MPPLVWWGFREPGTLMTEHDRLLLTALATHEADFGPCGHPLSETTNPEYDRDDPEGTAYYKVLAPLRCLACTELARAQESFAGSLKDEHQGVMNGLLWSYELTPRKRPAGA